MNNYIIIYNAHNLKTSKEQWLRGFIIIRKNCITEQYSYSFANSLLVIYIVLNIFAVFLKYFFANFAVRRVHESWL